MDIEDDIKEINKNINALCRESGETSTKVDMIYTEVKSLTNRVNSLNGSNKQQDVRIENMNKMIDDICDNDERTSWFWKDMYKLILVSLFTAFLTYILSTYF